MSFRPHRRDLLKAAAVLPALALPAFASAPTLPSVIAPSLARSASATHRLYGAAMRADRLTADAALRAAVIADCSWITPEIDFKWNALEYRRGGWWFERADALATFASANGKQLRGHTLLWDQSTPDWAKAEMAEQRDWRLVDRWFGQALGRYAGQACEWDVVNEPIDTEHGKGDLRQTCFARAFGPGYIADAFHAARAQAPDLRLMLNEYGLDYGNDVERDRRRALLKLVEKLRHDGVPIGGVGIQAHLDLAKGPIDAPAITAMLREIAGMGLSISITELDVKEANRALPVPVRDRAGADEVRRYADIVLAEPAVRGIVSWGLSDRDSWLQDGLGPDQANRGLPFDTALRPKPIYWALSDAFGEAGHQRQA